MVESAPLGRRAEGLSGFTLILLGTLVAGITSYVITWLVPWKIGLAHYASFAIFWSSLYLVVGALFGIQQEVTRGTRRVDPDHRPEVSRARNFGVVGSLVVFVAILATAPLWAGAVFPLYGWSLVWPLAVGAASYVIVAVLAGTLFGVSEWHRIALMVMVDAFMRLIGLAIVLMFTTNVVVLAWAVALPFPGSLVVVWPFVRRAIIGKTQLDTDYRTTVWNAARTVLAAASTGVMVSGFPLLLGLTSQTEPLAIRGLFILSITLTRAPLIVIFMSLQSYFVVSFRDEVHGFGRTFVRLQLSVIGSGLVLALAGWLAGPTVFGWLFPRQMRPEGWFLAVLVGSSAIVGALCISGSAVLAHSQHFFYAAGWFVGALVTTVLMLLPIDFTAKTVSALIVGPLAGLVVHGGYLISAWASGRASQT